MLSSYPYWADAFPGPGVDAVQGCRQVCFKGSAQGAGRNASVKDALPLAAGEDPGGCVAGTRVLAGSGEGVFPAVTARRIASPASAASPSTSAIRPAKWT